MQSDSAIMQNQLSWKSISFTPRGSAVRTCHSVPIILRQLSWLEHCSDKAGVNSSSLFRSTSLPLRGLQRLQLRVLELLNKADSHNGQCSVESLNGRYKMLQFMSLSSNWLGHHPFTVKIAGSNPASDTNITVGKRQLGFFY